LPLRKTYSYAGSAKDNKESKHCLNATRDAMLRVARIRRTYKNDIHNIFNSIENIMNIKNETYPSAR